MPAVSRTGKRPGCPRARPTAPNNPGLVDYELSAADRGALRQARNKVSGGIAIAALGVALPIAYYLKFVKSAHQTATNELHPSPLAADVINHPWVPLAMAAVGLAWGGLVAAAGMRMERIVTKRLEKPKHR